MPSIDLVIREIDLEIENTYYSVKSINGTDTHSLLPITWECQGKKPNTE